MSEPVLNCEVQQPERLQVGDIFSLNCTGSLAQTFQSSAQVVHPDEKNKLNLKILKVRQSDSIAHVFDVVSYRAQEFKDQSFLISDGILTARVSGLNWTVESVLQEGAEPYPAYPAEKMSYPLWLWGTLLALLLVSAVLIYRWYKARKTREALIEAVLGTGYEGKSFRELVKIQNSQAYSQLSRDLRTLQKEIKAFKPREPEAIWLDLQKAFRFYLVRELLTPAFDWSDTALLKDIQKNHRKVFKAAHVKLRRVLSEFNRGQKQKVSLSDCEQMLEFIREATDAVYEVRVKGR